MPMHFSSFTDIETAYSMLKGKLGSALRSKSDTGQINEVLCKVLCHNICVLVQVTHELGIDLTFGSKRTFGSEFAPEPKVPL